MAQYPPKDSERGRPARALIAAVEPESPADDAGFEAGCYLTSVDGEPLRDVIDWRWLSGADEIEVGYVDLDGDEGMVALWREPGEDWGFEFDGLVFDGVKQCCNNCTFCFMHQLPRGMRRSLYLRDDDFRLSFLIGTFVTLTNLSREDEARVVEQRISPLRVSLQASNADVRRRLIGRHAQHGIDALERLLAAGIEFHAQIVLVPGENDGAILEETLAWAYARPGILSIGIVPLGFTRHQTRFDRSFNDPERAKALLGIVGPYQRRAMAERGSAWVFAADEFYCNAYGARVLDHLPDTAHYGDFSLFEDGVGMIRSAVDDWERAAAQGAIAACSELARAKRTRVNAIVGLAQREFFGELTRRHGVADWLAPLFVRNDFFGGNVDVTGLLTAQDIARAVREDAARAESSATAPARSIYVIPDVIFNDDGLTLDDRTLADLEKESGVPIHMVSCSPERYFPEITEILKRY
ncbi:MAG: DUF512 domain-containing protein [Eggerthellaceae bacterium]|nr:DUF512 domain-containing protein [Eggerthellaceae bacterium]